MIFILLIFGIVCFIIIRKILIKVHRYYFLWQQMKDIPKTSASTIIGNSFELMGMTDTERAHWHDSLLYRFKNGLFVHWIGGEPKVEIYKPEYVQIILSSSENIQKGMSYDLIRPWLGNGLLTATGAQWYHDRKLIRPAFHFNMLEQYAMAMSEKAEILIKCLDKKLEKNPGEAIDIFPFAINVALDIISETVMGVNLHAQETETEYSATVHRALQLMLKRLIRPWYWIEWIYNLTANGKEYKSIINKLHEFTKEIINKKKTLRQNGSGRPEKEGDEFDIGERKKKAFLDLLLDLNEMDSTPLTDDELRAQVDTLMFAGHDTTAVAVTWALFSLGNNLEQQEKVHEELDEVFKNSESPASIKELAQLKYLDRVIKETLRLYPSVPVITRKLIEDTKIGNYTIPKGVLVALVISFMHRNPQVWSNPEQFDPDRFLPENSKGRKQYAYIPFSAGLRNCIGQRFAQLEEKIILTAILRKWRVKSVKSRDTLNFGDTVVLRPYEEVLLHFIPKK